MGKRKSQVRFLNARLSPIQLQVANGSVLNYFACKTVSFSSSSPRMVFFVLAFWSKVASSSILKHNILYHFLIHNVFCHVVKSITNGQFICVSDLAMSAEITYEGSSLITANLSVSPLPLTTLGRCIIL